MSTGFSRRGMGFNFNTIPQRLKPKILPLTLLHG
jgi:hypothetical protein